MTRVMMGHAPSFRAMSRKMTVSRLTHHAGDISATVFGYIQLVITRNSIIYEVKKNRDRTVTCNPKNDHKRPRCQLTLSGIAPSATAAKR